MKFFVNLGKASRAKVAETFPDPYVCHSPYLGRTLLRRGKAQVSVPS